MENKLKIPETSGKGWSTFFDNKVSKPDFQRLISLVNEEYNAYDCFPSKENIFRAFELTPLERVKVVILGQDPYPTPGNANGLAFSVNKGQKLPMSLRNIFKELSLEYKTEPRTDGDLTDWAKQGVLLLNTVLTVRKKSPNSHKGLGWESFTDDVIRYLDSREQSMAFILWGNKAKEKMSLLQNKNHLVLTASHPSPMSANKGGFFGCNCFINANGYLKENGLEMIKWM